MRVALIGVGGWGKNHARVLSELGVLCAVCDKDAERCDEFGRKYSVNCHTTAEELLREEEFDAAVIATPTRTHFDIAIRMIEAKKHILVEKPITHESGKGQILVELARKNKTVLTCGYIERFNPAVSRVKSQIDRQEYGELIMLEFHRGNRVPARVGDVGIIYDTAVHDIDTANWLFGEMPSVVFARASKIGSEHENFASIMLGYKNERTAVISSNWVTPKKIRTFKAVCTNASIISDFISQEITVDGNICMDIPQDIMQEPLHLEIDSFLRAVEGACLPVVEPQQAVNITRIAEAALLSSKKGVPIYLELK